jgi:hypothetical protein
MWIWQYLLLFIEKLSLKIPLKKIASSRFNSNDSEIIKSEEISAPINFPLIKL